MTIPGTATLASALDAGTARFGAGPVIEVTGRGAARTRHKLAAWLGAFPATATLPAVRHGSGLVYVTLLGHLVGMPRSSAPPPLRPGQPVQVATGVCLSPGAGPGLSVYEAETTATLGGFIAALAALPGIGDMTVTAHIPAAEYWLRGAPAAQVDARARMVTAALAAHLGEKVTVRAGSPLDWARHAHPQAVAAATAAAGGITELIHAAALTGYRSAARRAAAGGEALLIVEEPGEAPIWAHAGLSPGTAVCYVHPGLVATGVTPAHLYSVEAPWT